LHQWIVCMFHVFLQFNNFCYVGSFYLHQFSSSIFSGDILLLLLLVLTAIGLVWLLWIECNHYWATRCRPKACSDFNGNDHKRIAHYRPDVSKCAEYWRGLTKLICPALLHWYWRCQQCLALSVLPVHLIPFWYMD
jgi:hypothetical protein